MTATSAAPLGAHYAKAAPPVPTTITRPGKTARSRDIVIEGRILGTMHARGRVHHYRVEGADGVLYLCPPDWLPDDPLGSNATDPRFVVQRVADALGVRIRLLGASA